MSVKPGVWLACVFVCLAIPLSAQQPGATATLRGRVVDPQGRGVAAQVRVVSSATGLERETQSDASGHFSVGSIPPSDSDLIVSAQGFAERRVPGVRLEVGQAVAV